MRNIFAYYFAIFAPLALLIIVFKQGLLSSVYSFWIFLFYTLIYRTLVDGFRLWQKGLITKNEIWKVATHGIRAKYFKELYFNK